MNRLDWLKYYRDLFGEKLIFPVNPINELKTKIENCRLCALSQSRRNFVFGDGNPQSPILFIGEAPGEQEDLRGIPFVGRAGQLLDKLLAEIDLQRSDVFIANVLKCRPPANRDPLPEEIALCEPYLHEQIRIINPKVIVALGRIAGKTLLKKDLALKEMRGKTLQYQGVDLMVTYHPAAILRNMNMLNMIQDDFRILKDKYWSRR
ncbi:MAG TPA: uracil-DNA glycosylase [Candidatus Marinimicrobia bacterium]|nr:uracil-DNA glycosylase [Candidatus Neomarinimicrobiota bacterium]